MCGQHTCQVAGHPRGGGGGGSPLFTPLEGGDFVNSKFAIYFHQLGRLITIKLMIKPLFIFNQQYSITCLNRNLTNPDTCLNRLC